MIQIAETLCQWIRSQRLDGMEYRTDASGQKDPHAQHGKFGQADFDTPSSTTTLLFHFSNQWKALEHQIGSTDKVGKVGGQKVSDDPWRIVAGSNVFHGHDIPPVGHGGTGSLDNGAVERNDGQGHG